MFFEHIVESLRYSIVNRLGSFFPGAQVLYLFRGKRIDLHTHRFEFEAGDLIVNISGYGVNLLFELVRILCHKFRGKSLVSERHVHHGGGVTFGGGKVDETSFAEDVDLATVLGEILVHKWADE